MPEINEYTAFPDRVWNFKNAACAEPTLDDLLDDPLTRALMRADRVNVTDVERMLNSVAATLRAHSDQTGPSAPSRPIVSTVSVAPSHGLPASPIPHFRPDSASSKRDLVVAKASKIMCGSACQW